MCVEIPQSMSTTTSWAEFGYLYEQEGTRLLRGCLRSDAADDLNQGRVNFFEAFQAWTQFAKASKGNLERPGRGAGDEITHFRGGLEMDLLRSDLLLAFRLCASGLLGSALIDMRGEVEKFVSVRAKGRGDFLIKVFVELNGPAPRAKLITSWLEEWKSLRAKPRHSDPVVAATLEGLDILTELLSDISRPILDGSIRWEKPAFHLTDVQKRADILFAKSSAADFLRHFSLLLVLSLHEMIHGFRVAGNPARKENSLPPTTPRISIRSTRVVASPDEPTPVRSPSAREERIPPPAPPRVKSE